MKHVCNLIYYLLFIHISKQVYDRTHPEIYSKVYDQLGEPTQDSIVTQIRRQTTDIL